MTLLASGIGSRRPLKIVTCSAAALGLALLIGASPIANREAIATTSVGVAARNADADLSSCGKNTGTALYGCVADVLNLGGPVVRHVALPEVKCLVSTSLVSTRSGLGRLDGFATCQANHLAQHLEPEVATQRDR